MRRRWWVVGRGLGLLRGASSGWCDCVRCSPGRESLENGGPADSRRQWLGPLTTDGQPCGEHLTHQPLLRFRTLRPHRVIHFQSVNRSKYAYTINTLIPTLLGQGHLYSILIV